MRHTGTGWLHSAILAGICSLALAPTLATAQPLTKQQIYDQMLALTEQRSAIKGDPSRAGELLQLEARFDELVAELGYRPSFPPRSATQPVPPIAPILPTPPANCATATDSFDSTDTPLPITDMATTMSVLSVSGIGTTIHDVDVQTSITHTWNADLEIVLTSPSGTAVTLSTNNGGSNDNVFNGTLWDDGGDTNPPGPVTDNVFADLVVETPLVPEEALGHFRGEDPNGDWTLTITDGADMDTGSLGSWSLTFLTSTEVPVDTTTGFPSTDTPLPITDMATTMSTLAVSGLDTYICDVDVQTSITHTWNADLDIVLTSPAGTAMTLSTGNGGSNDNVFDGTLWTDDAGAINPPGPVTDNVFADLVTETPLCPEEAFGAFAGEDPNGNWTLAITDSADEDVGNLASWSLDVTTCRCPLADLQVTKTGAAVGSQVTWTITATNNGPDDATGVVITDPLDVCSTYVSDDCGGANVPPWTWNIGNLANGGMATCNVVVDASGCAGALANTAMVSGDQTDPETANDTAAATVVIQLLSEVPTLRGAGLALLLAALAGCALWVLRRSV